MNRLLAMLVAGCTLALPTVGLADAVPSPPTNCPDGSHGRTGHAGPWCNPPSCTTDADCREEGTTCRDAALCVETEQYRMGGWAGDQQATREVAHGPCGADGQCSTGQCRQAKHCMRTGGGEASPGSGGSGGATPGPDTDTGTDTEPDTGEATTPDEEPPTTADGPGKQPAGEPTREPAQPSEAQEGEEDGGCSSAGRGSVPIWAVSLVALALGATRRRHR